jgi:hypothetical protein
VTMVECQKLAKMYELFEQVLAIVTGICGITTQSQSRLLRAMVASS